MPEYGFEFLDGSFQLREGGTIGNLVVINRPLCLAGRSCEPRSRKVSTAHGGLTG
jgi:hypothetical protein